MPIPRLDIRRFYDCFQTPITGLDCGQKCSPNNPSGKPFCCDICHAVPAAFHQEWEYLQRSTDLWHVWRGDECTQDPGAGQDLRDGTPESMLLLACLGPAHCQRDFRAISCRQFPFFPYITSDAAFIGLAYEWAFEPVCWVIGNLGQVSAAYRTEFIRAFDALFDLWPDEMENYAVLSEEMRVHFAARRRRIPLLHRSGADYLLSPGSERLRRVENFDSRR